MYGLGHRELAAIPKWLPHPFFPFLCIYLFFLYTA